MTRAYVSMTVRLMSMFSNARTIDALPGLCGASTGSSTQRDSGQLTAVVIEHGMQTDIDKVLEQC